MNPNNPQQITITQPCATAIAEYLGEEWKPVVGWEGYYEVSNYGRIRSLARRVPHKQNGFFDVKPRIMGFMGDRKGYLYVKLSKDSACKNMKNSPSCG